MIQTHILFLKSSRLVFPTSSTPRPHLLPSPNKHHRHNRPNPFYHQFLEFRPGYITHMALSGPLPPNLIPLFAAQIALSTTHPIHLTPPPMSAKRNSTSPHQQTHLVHLSRKPPPFADYWREEINCENKSLLTNNTWNLVPRKPDMNILPCMYIFRMKNSPKVRLVALGSHQQPGIY